MHKASLTRHSRHPPCRPGDRAVTSSRGDEVADEFREQRSVASGEQQKIAVAFRIERSVELYLLRAMAIRYVAKRELDWGH